MKSRINICCVAGARPNFMKIAPIMAALEKIKQFSPMLVHTGQHFDYKMSDVFFKDLELSKPDVYLGVKGGSHAVQTSLIMQKFSKVLASKKPDLVLVVGDVTSTLACALAARRQNIRVAHVEAGLRSFDISMPEEINRILTDSISDILFTTSPIADENLLQEGFPSSRIFRVGNCMIDSLMKLLKKHDYFSDYKPGILPHYAVLTLHRPSNVDDPVKLKQFLKFFIDWSITHMPILFPVHPRTKARIDALGLGQKDFGNLMFTPPQSYVEFIRNVAKSKLVFTDSGGVQEEASILGVPCLTLRQNTERPITIHLGTNHLVGTSLSQIHKVATNVLKKSWKPCKIALWDGNSAGRIASVLRQQSIKWKS